MTAGVSSPNTLKLWSTEPTISFVAGLFQAQDRTELMPLAPCKQRIHLQQLLHSRANELWTPTATEPQLEFAHAGCPIYMTTIKGAGRGVVHQCIGSNSGRTMVDCNSTQTGHTAGYSSDNDVQVC